MIVVNIEELKQKGQLIGDRLIINSSNCSNPVGIKQYSYNLSTGIRTLNAIFRLK